jgi:hypothetical protein
MKPLKARDIARILLLLWAGWWVYFALASGLADRTATLAQALLQTALVGLIFFGSIALAWRWEAMGGGLLVLEGLGVVIAFAVGFFRPANVSTLAFVLLTLALPPFVAGLLFLADWWRSSRFGTTG